jgi:hypothetical protein
MVRKFIAAPQQISSPWRWSLVLCTFAYVVCILVTTAPLHNMIGIHSPLLMSRAIVRVDRLLHLPADLHFAQNPYASRQETSYLEFALFIILAFAVYGLGAYSLQYHGEQSNYTFALYLIWLGMVASSCIYIFTPASTSNDIGSYASYGQLLIIHHANPYFIPPAAYPQDPTYHSVYWKHVVSIYGPVWTVISSLLALLSDTSNIGYLTSFRLFACVAHLLNTLLVAAILRAMGCSPRTIALGTLLYAWNPLVLLESCLGGHNDVLMITFILLGILLSVRTERSDRNGFRGYVLPLVVFTLAVLVKLGAIPIVVFFVVMLFWKTFQRPSPRPGRWDRLLRWRAALLTALLAGFISSAVVLSFYAPFWIGHSIEDIAHSFSSQPTVYSAFDSIFLLIRVLIKIHELPIYFALFNNRRVWNTITFVAVMLTTAAGVVLLRQAPTTRTVVLATLFSLEVFILVTPWFVSWYVIWLVGLAVVCLPLTSDPLGRALCAFALAFSVSAFLTYYYIGLGQLIFNPSRIGWFILACLSTFGIPLMAFLICLVFSSDVTSRSNPLTYFSLL